jgi:hypothetical protein
MTITVNQSPWVTLRKGDASFQLKGDITVTNRAAIEITGKCPQNLANIIADAAERGYIECVAMVPRNDPTLMWDLLKTKEA